MSVRVPTDAPDDTYDGTLTASNGQFTSAPAPLVLTVHSDWPKHVILIFGTKNVSRFEDLKKSLPASLNNILDVHEYMNSQGGLKSTSLENARQLMDEVRQNMILLANLMLAFRHAWFVRSSGSNLKAFSTI